MMVDRVARTMFSLGVGFVFLALLNFLTDGGSLNLQSFAYAIVLLVAAVVCEVLSRAQRRRDVRALAAKLPSSW